jgi:hypothetical protein
LRLSKTWLFDPVATAVFLPAWPTLQLRGRRHHGESSQSIPPA